MMLTREQELARRCAHICAPCALAAGGDYAPGHQAELFRHEPCGMCGRSGTTMSPAEFDWPVPGETDG